MDKFVWILISALIFPSTQAKTIGGNVETTERDDELRQSPDIHPFRDNKPLNLEKVSNKSLQNSFRVLQVPRKYFEKSILIVEANCKEAVLGVDILVSAEAKAYFLTSRKLFHCHSRGNKTFKIILKLPRYIAYRPSRLNKYSVFVESATLQIWLVEERGIVEERAFPLYFSIANHTFESTLQILKPFDRPSRPIAQCFDWFTEQFLKLPYSPQCDVENEVVNAITFPVVLSGFLTGVHRLYIPFTNPNLRQLQLDSLRKPSFSFVIWLFVDNYCPFHDDHCSILHHITWDDRYATPHILINNYGQVSVELVMEDGSSTFFTSSHNQVIPRHTWTRLLLTCLPKQCDVFVSYGRGWKLQWNATIKINESSTFYFDDTTGLIVFGGSELMASFRGYIGKATFYRRRAITIEEAGLLNRDDVAMKLELNKRQSKCYKYTEQINYLMQRGQENLRKAFQKVTCPIKPWNPFYDTSPSRDIDTCSAFQFQKFLHYDFVYRLVKGYVYSGRPFYHEDIADQLYSYTGQLLDKEGANSMELIISLLKQSSCLGNHDASFMLSVVLNYGLTVKSHEIQSHSYLMYGALEGNILCLLSLGNKHIYSMDGLPIDYEQGYVYFKSVADMTSRDLQVHKGDDVMTEMVRLTNDVEMKEQTEEDGDITQYLKMQAAQGAYPAQRSLARMYYWGSGGLARDIEMAFRYYRMAAESNDPAALYDYGIVLLKGHGTKKNMSLAVEMLKKSAAQGFAQALNTLGWHAMEIEKNMTLAAEYFHLSHDQGNKDASYNLAHMFLKGKYPNSSVDKVRAWDYISTGALRGQYEAGILVGMYNMRGHPKLSRNLNLAVGWARFVAEKNPGVGRLLSKGVKAYKSSNWFPALVYYLMSASTGVEVANFNLAYLCDEDNDGFVKYLDKECKWRHYNLSIQRAPTDADPYAWNKMAYYYHHYGINGKRDTQSAIILYYNAAKKGDPQGLYNLAELVSEGVNISSYFLDRLSIPSDIQSDKLLLVTHLLLRCQDTYNSNAYLPCTFALYRVVFQYYWSLFQSHFKSIAVFVTLVMAAFVSFHSINGQHRGPDL